MTRLLSEIGLARPLQKDSQTYAHRYHYDGDLDFMLANPEPREKNHALWEAKARVLWDRQMETPVRVASILGRRDPRPPHYWMFHGRVYLTNEDLTGADVAALVLQTENKKRAALSRAHAAAEMAAAMGRPHSRREPIPDDVKVLVWQRDGGACVRCSSRQGLEFDHIIPVVMGGANTVRNLQLLCEGCNRSKGGSLV